MEYRKESSWAKLVSRFYKINLNIQEYDAEAEDSWFLDVGDFIENQDKIMASLIFLDNPDFTKAVKRLFKEAKRDINQKKKRF